MPYIGHGQREIRERLLPLPEARRAARGLKRVEVGGRIARECIDLAYGFFSPLEGFMGSADTEEVCASMRLADGTLWPIPILLDLPEAELREKAIREGRRILLTHQGRGLGLMEVQEIFDFDRQRLAESVLGTSDERHPGVRLIRGMRDRFLAGRITLVNPPLFQPPFDRFWYTPRTLRDALSGRGWERVVAHQSRNVPHTGHEWLMKGAWFAANGTLPVETLRTGILVNCIIGPKRVGDYIDEAIVLGHQALHEAGYFRDDVHLVSIALWDMRYAGPREAVFHAILRTNLGCTHHMFGRDHAGVGSTYDPYDSHRIFDRLPPGSLSIQPVRLLEWWYCPVEGGMSYSGLCGHDEERQNISGTMLRSIIQDRVRPTRAIMRPEVFEQVVQAGDRYGFGSPFCTERYLAERQPVFTLEEL